MLSPLPRPNWHNIGRAILRPPLTDAALASPWMRGDETAGWLSHAAWAFALIAIWRTKLLAASAPTFWVPEDTGEVSLAKLREVGFMVIRYPLTADCTPDLAACKAQVEAFPPAVFMLAHPLGRPIATAGARAFCERHAAWLVEDASHALRPADGIGNSGDFVIYSPHRHLPIPDGALLLVRPEGPSKLGPDAVHQFGPPSTWPMQFSVATEDAAPTAWARDKRAKNWLASTILSKLGLRLQPPALLPLSPVPSGLGRRLLATFILEVPEVARRRQRNQLLWDHLLTGASAQSNGGPKLAERPDYRAWTPIQSAYFVTESSAPRLFEDYHRRGLPVASSPDDAAVRSGATNARQFRDGRIYLAIHQGLSSREILARWQKPAMTTSLVVRTEWDKATRAQWSQWMIAAGRSNLLQSWAYGDAKADAAGWQVRRAVFYREQEPIAVAQVLQKRVLGLVGVVRINRGPLPLRPLAPDECRVIFAGLARIGTWWRGRILTMAPELNLSGHALALMTELGFRQFSPIAYESAWLDLHVDLDGMHKRLSGTWKRWRGMLKSPEKTPLRLVISQDARVFEWMMSRYQELMHENSFTGASVEFLRALRQNLRDEEQLVVLRALHEGEPVAGLCLARHGTAASYLAGWNGERGRQLRAHQYLLWQAIIYLKNSKFRWFDLGGISEENTPGIAAFKLGLSGERYELIGEYWKW